MDTLIQKNNYIKLEINGQKKKLYHFNCIAENFIDKMMFLYGSSGSGKTSIIKQILSIIDPLIHFGMIITKTKIENEYRNIIPSCLTFDYNNDDININIERINSFVEVQKKRTAIYEATFNLRNLTLVFRKLTKYIKLLEPEWYHKYIIKLADWIEKKKEIERECIGLAEYQVKEKLQEITKKNVDALRYIIYHLKPALLERDDFNQKKLFTQEEEMLFNCIDINPHGLLIMEDCASAFKEFNKAKKNPHRSILKDLLFNGRHYHITFIAVTQADTCIDTDLRQNIHINIFATLRDAGTYSNKRTNMDLNYKNNIFDPQAISIFKTPYRRMIMYQFRGTLQIFYLDGKLVPVKRMKMYKELWNNEKDYETKDSSCHAIVSKMRKRTR